MENEKLLKIGEASKLLGVNPITLRRWEKSEVIIPIRVGRRGDRRYKESILLKLLRDKPHSRTDSQAKGVVGENVLFDLLKQLLNEWGFSPIELRPQESGIQFGKDNISSWKGIIDGEETTFAWSFEAKHYGKEDKKRVIGKEKILSKLSQIHSSSVPIDCWCIFSPFGYVDNEVRELVDLSFDQNKYPFRIVLWTINEQIEELIKCFPEIYQKLYESQPVLAEGEREGILKRWRLLVVEKTREGKSLRAKTGSQDNNFKEDFSPMIARDIKKALIEEGIQLSLSTTPSSQKTDRPNMETVFVNEEIDSALKLLNQDKVQEAMTKFFLLLGKVEDKEGLVHEKARLYNNIGVGYNFQKDTDRAIEYFKKAIKTEGNFTIALTNLSSAYITKSEDTTDKVESEKELEKAEKIILPLWESFSDKSTSTILQVYMRFLRTKKGVAGLIDFINTQIDTPTGKMFNTNGTLAFIIASTFLEVHEPEKALEYAKKAYELDKEDPEVVFLRGRAFISLSAKENFPATINYWQDIVPVFTKKDNLKKGIKDIDDAMEIANHKGVTSMLPQLYFLQRMSRIWLGEDQELPSVDMQGMEDEKRFLEMYDAFKKRDYEHSFAILKLHKEFHVMPYEEKSRIARAFLSHGQPEISKELFDSIKEEAIKREDFMYWLDYSVIATLLGEKNLAILTAAKAKEVAKGEKARRMVHSHYGAVILRFADDKEGDRLLKGAWAFEKEFPDVKILTSYNYEEEKDKILGMMKQQQEWFKNIKKIYTENPIPSYYLEHVFKQPYIMVWGGRDPEMPIEFTITSEEFNKQLEDNYSSGKVFVFDYISLLTVSKLNLLVDLEKIFPRMQITLSLFDKIQEEMLKKEDDNLRRLWNFLRKSKVVEIVENINKQKFVGEKIDEIFESWILDTLVLSKQRGARLVTDDFRFFRFVKSENIRPLNSMLILHKAKEKKLLDTTMYSRAIGKLAECFYTFTSFNGDDLFEIVFQDDFKLTARTYHLINQIFLPGTNITSFTQVFVRFISRLCRPGMIIDDKLFWLDYITGIYAELLMRAADGATNKEEVLLMGPGVGLMWRIALKNADKDDVVVLISKFAEMLKQPILKPSKEKIQQMIGERAIELGIK